MFDALGQTDILGVGEVSRVLTEALITLGHQKNVKPLEFVGKFLLDHAGFGTQQFSLSQPKKVSTGINFGIISFIRGFMYQLKRKREGERKERKGRKAENAMVDRFLQHLRMWQITGY